MFSPRLLVCLSSHQTILLSFFCWLVFSLIIFVECSENWQRKDLSLHAKLETYLMRSDSLKCRWVIVTVDYGNDLNYGSFSSIYKMIFKCHCILGDGKTDIVFRVLLGSEGHLNSEETWHICISPHIYKDIASSLSRI